MKTEDLEGYRIEPGFWEIPEDERNRIYAGCGPGHLGDYFVPDRMFGLSVKLV